MHSLCVQILFTHEFWQVYPKQLYKPAAPLTTSMLIILLSQRENLRVHDSLDCEAGGRNCWHSLFFCIGFPIIENAMDKNFDSMVPLLDIHQATERALSHFHSALDGKLCNVADKVSVFLTQWKPNRSFKCTVCGLAVKNRGRLHRVENLEFTT